MEIRKNEVYLHFFVIMTFLWKVALILTHCTRQTTRCS